ncbi:MAG: hypothetical protein Q8W48_07475 [Candidatus Palauibacterales bacterium]|nr:hypothetical protein [Candidatus Palauibacterales bacterium]
MRSSVCRVLLITSLIAVLSPSAGWAQRRSSGALNRYELTGFVGYLWGGGVDVVGGQISTKAAADFGGILDIRIRRDAMIEFSYTRQNTELLRKDLAGPTTVISDMGVDFFQIGILGEARQLRGPAVPFISLTFGATHFSPETNTLSDEWRFSTILGGGVKALFSEHVGVRAQGRLLATFLNSGSSVWCGGGGCSLGLFGTGLLQGEVSGGLVLAF